MQNQNSNPQQQPSKPDLSGFVPKGANVVTAGKQSYTPPPPPSRKRTQSRSSKAGNYKFFPDVIEKNIPIENVEKEISIVEEMSKIMREGLAGEYISLEENIAGEKTYVTKGKQLDSEIGIFFQSTSISLDTTTTTSTIATTSKDEHSDPDRKRRKIEIEDKNNSDGDDSDSSENESYSRFSRSTGC